MISKDIFKTDIDVKNFRILKYSKIEPRDFINPICLLGMPGIADIGKFAVDQLIGILDAEKFADIIFYDYPAGAIIDESILSTPKAEILTYHDKKKERDLVLITADAQAMTPRGIYEISDLIAEILYEFRVKEIVSLGAFPGKRNKQDKVGIYVTKTEEFELSQYDSVEICKRINKGVIIGANGLIPTLAKARFKIPGTVLLAETENQTSLNEGFTDLKASVILLENVARLYNLPIEGVFTGDKVQELSKDLEEKRKKLEKELETYHPMEEIVEQDKTLYI